MGTVVVTGSGGFIGRNLVATLGLLPEVTVRTFDLQDDPGALAGLLADADFVFHFAPIPMPCGSEGSRLPRRHPRARRKGRDG